MKKALVSPLDIDVPVTYVSGWTNETPAEVIFSNIENAYRIIEVANQSFEVSKPLFWVDCPDETIADAWYFDINTSLCLPKDEVPNPNPPLPSG